MSFKGVPNIGKTLEKELESIGIESVEDLKALGSVEATRRIGASGNACYNKLYALEGAIRGIRWHDIPKEERAVVKAKYDSE